MRINGTRKNEVGRRTEMSNFRNELEIAYVSRFSIKSVS